MGRVQRDVLRVFIGSPGDLQPERKKAREVVERVNRHLARNLGIYVELRGWEDTLPGSSRPQELINEDIKESDLFVGLVWRRWGSPTSQNGGYSSGFEEEFELAREQLGSGQLENIWLFFKEIDEERRRDPGEQLRQVLLFRSKVTEGKGIFYKEFPSLERWGELLYDSLVEYLTRESGLGSSPDSSVPRDNGDSAIAVRGSGLLESIDAVSKAVSSDDVGAVDRLQTTRVYLATVALLNAMRTETTTIGIHEDQYLYRLRDRVQLTRLEQLYVLMSLTADRDGVLAGWRWVSLSSEEVGQALLYLTATSQFFTTQIDALDLLFHLDRYPDLDTLMNTIDTSDSLVVDRALRLLGRVAPMEDLTKLTELAQTSTPDIAEEAWKAALAVLARHSPEQAIEWLKGPGSYRDEHTVRIIRPVLAGIGAEAIRELLDDRSPSVRRVVFERLKESLPEPVVRKLSRDENGSIRAGAYEELVRRGEGVSEEEIEECVPEKERPTYSVGDPSIDEDPPTPSREDVLFEYYRRMPYAELSAEIGWSSLKAPLRYEALSDRYFAEFKQTLRSDVEDDFARLEDASFLPNIDESSLDEDEREQVRELLKERRRINSFVKETFRRAAFRSLSKHAEAEDARLARALLSERRFGLMEHDLVRAAFGILWEHGAEDDQELVGALISETHYPGIKAAGAQLYLRLAAEPDSDAFARLAGFKEDGVVRGALQYVLSNPNWLAFADAQGLLYSDRSDLRVLGLAFLARTRSRQELVSLLNEYPNRSSRYYYDVVCWLDRVLFSPERLRGEYLRRLQSKLRPQILY